RAGASYRISSYDHEGANRDNLTLEPGEQRTLAKITGAGVIRHIWVTMNSEDPEYLRHTVTRFYWDREKEPSVNVPIGDLFGLGHARVVDFDSAPISVARSPHLTDPTGRGGMNLFFPMPFSDGARV